VVEDAGMLAVRSLSL